MTMDAIVKLLETGDREMGVLYRSTDRVKALEVFLENMLPVLVHALQQTVAGGPFIEWLLNVERVLFKMEGEVKRSKEVGSWNVLKKRQVMRRLSNIMDDLRDVFFRQSPICSPSFRLSSNLSPYAEVQTSLIRDEIQQAVDEIRHKQHEQKLGLDEVEIEDAWNNWDVRANSQEILDNLRQLPHKIFGFDLPLADLKNNLFNKFGKKWVGIHGPAGSGKTLLAELAFSGEDVRGNFHHLFWITVGDKPLIRPLLENLARQMYIKTENMVAVELKTRLHNALRKMKVLLVLDAVGDDEDVLDSLDITSGTGSKILVTTRDIKVLKENHALTSVYMWSLSAEYSWTLFCEHAFRGVDNIPRQLNEEVVRALGNECEGLPLALRVTGRALAHEQSPLIWRRELFGLREGRSFDGGQDVLFRALQLCYDSLASVDRRLQRCFIEFAAATPEGCDGDSEKWANLWAETKVLEAGDGATDDFDPLEECFYLLSELIQRSLIDLQWSEASNPLHIKCRVHGAVRDFARLHISHRQAPTGEGPRSKSLFGWYEDPLIWEKMCDPVVCSDGRTYDRWTIINSGLRKSPFDPSIPNFDILVDNIELRSRLFENYPEQELTFRDLRKKYKNQALQHGRSSPHEVENALEKLSNVLKWLPLDKECQTEHDRILQLVSQQSLSQESTVLAGIPETVLRHEDLIIARGRDLENRVATLMVFSFLAILFLIT